MENVITLAFLTVAIFCFAKFIEMRFVDEDKEMKPLKFFVRDVVLVFLSACIAAFVFFHLQTSIQEFVNIATDVKAIHPMSTQIFTGDPGF